MLTHILFVLPVDIMIIVLFTIFSHFSDYHYLSRLAGDGRLSLKQKSLDVELAGSFNQGKRTNLVKKLDQNQRMNKARCQGNLADLLQGPKIQTAENSNSEVNKENIPPLSQFFRKNSCYRASNDLLCNVI